ncbi:Sak single strand annealing protein, partial [Limosilactobacillus reuteri]
VTCTVHIDGNDYTESLYVMDNSNNAVIDSDQAQINKTQKRCLVKALAMAGLGLNLYAGEDLPMGDISEQDKKKQEALEKAKRAKEKADQEKNEKLNQEYRELIDKSVEVTGKDVVTIEEGIKKLAKSKQPNFDSLSNAVRKSMLIEILQQTLKKYETTEQQGLEEVN